ADHVPPERVSGAVLRGEAARALRHEGALSRAVRGAARRARARGVVAAGVPRADSERRGEGHVLRASARRFRGGGAASRNDAARSLCGNEAAPFETPARGFSTTV